MRWSCLPLVFVIACGDPCADPGALCTVSGTGEAGYGGDGGLAGLARLYFPIDLAVDPEGQVYIDDWNNQRVRRIDTNGVIATVLGTGFEGFLVDGAAGTETPLHHAFSLAFGAGGELYVAGNHAAEVLALAPDGSVRLVAGTGVEGFAGDGGPALAAELRAPCGVAAGADGVLYVADTENHRIRSIDAGGLIHTVAGTGVPGFGGDGEHARAAQLSSPHRVHVGPDGALWIADTLNHRIRRVDPGGTIATVAGDGAEAFGGDGGPALAASLSSPYDVLVRADGGFYIADSGNSRVRLVDPDGTITTVAGNGVTGYDGEGLPALDSALGRPRAVVYDAGGALLIADTFNHRVRRVTPAE